MVVIDFIKLFLRCVLVISMFLSIILITLVAPIALIGSQLPDGSILQVIAMVVLFVLWISFFCSAMVMIDNRG